MCTEEWRRPGGDSENIPLASLSWCGRVTSSSCVLSVVILHSKRHTPFKSTCNLIFPHFSCIITTFQSYMLCVQYFNLTSSLYLSIESSVTSITDTCLDFPIWSPISLFTVLLRLVTTGYRISERPYNDWYVFCGHKILYRRYQISLSSVQITLFILLFNLSMSSLPF